MGIFRRMSHVVSANFHTLLDLAEDPERMLAHAIRDLEAGLAVARRDGALAIAAERRLERELTENRKAAETWKAQAGLALNSDREDLSRLALARMLEHSDLADALKAQWQAARATSRDVRTALRSLESQLANARRKQRILIARHRAATIRLALQQTMGRDAFDGSLTLTRFAHFEERLLDMEDRILAEAELARPASELETELAELETQKRVDEQLVLLKGSATTAPGATTS